MTKLLTEKHYKLIEKIAEQNNFTQYSTEEYSTSSKGDNYVGEIICVRIKSSDRILELVVKKAPVNEQFRKVMPIGEIFLNEIFVYNELLPTFVKFQKENGLKNIFDSYAKLYGYCEEENNECLVLENLTKNGYSHWNRKSPMNSGHVGHVMAEYGKLHAVSFAMKKKDPLLFKKLSNTLRKENTEFDRKNIKSFLKSTCAAIENAIKGNSLLEKAYERVLLNAEEYFQNLQESTEQNVITHGDCWCNNMLFKYEKSGDLEKPSKVCLIDWQIARMGSPLQDIVYFFYASSSKEILSDYKKYLKIYHDNLSHSLKQMSCDPEELFSFRDLESLWKVYGKYGLFIGAFVFRMLYVDSTECPDVAENSNTVEDFYGKFEGMGDAKKVNERI